MDEGFATQPGELTAAAASFDEAAGIVADALAALRTTLGGLGDPLGTDEQGRAFAAQYEPKATEGLTALAGEADAVRALAAALRASAQGYASGDAELSAGLPGRVRRNDRFG